jgi:predicted transposase YdaD
MMTLPKELQQSLKLKVKQYEEEKKMPLVSNFEKLAKEEGKEEGLQLGKQEGLQEGIEKEINLVIRLLNKKIGNLSSELELKIRSLPLEILENLGEDLLDFNSLDDLISWLDNHL